jgi:mannose-6-phosphate isomerase-like protein (cupin superfamily)
MDEIRVLNIKRDGIKFQMGNAFSWRVIHPEMGANDLTVSYGEHAPGMEFRQHVHEKSSDTIICVSGRGVLRTGDKRIPISAGDIVYVPAGIVHGTINTGDEPLIMFGIQVPPDPALYGGDQNSNTQK